MAKINFGGVEENVVTREEFPLEKAREVMKNETIAIIGYGVQGPGQALNLRDNGFNVIVGQRNPSKSYEKALNDGWVEGEILFSIEEALEKGTVIFYLLSDAAQIAVWPTVKSHLTEGKSLYFSHGFAVTYKERTGIIPPVPDRFKGVCTETNPGAQGQGSNRAVQGRHLSAMGTQGFNVQQADSGCSILLGFMV